MSLTERFKYFNKIDFSNFLNFRINNLAIGYISKYNAQVIKEYFKNNFILTKENFSLNKIDNTNSILNFDTLTDFFKEVTQYLLKKDIIDKITNEYFAVSALDSNDDIFKIERSVLHHFGIKSKGIHLNGYIVKENDFYIWIAKRSNTKLTFPGKLDNIVAGGISYGYDFCSTLIKESCEEASLNEDLLKNAVLCDKLHYLYPYKNGIRNDIMYIYNLELPLDFTPKKNDNEVEKFFLMDTNTLLSVLKNTNNFKFNSAISTILILLQKNLINNSNTHQITLNAIKNKLYNMQVEKQILIKR